MKLSIIVGVAVVTAFLTTLALIPQLVQSGTTEQTVVYVAQPKLSPAQIIWLAKLMLCESGIKTSAVNPNDLDNTPSYGLLQFKPSTYSAAAKQYGLASTSDYMNPQGQVAIVEHWVLDGGVNWAHQFPGCTAKLGLPPPR